jgi:hypothetical protein
MVKDLALTLPQDGMPNWGGPLRTVLLAVNDDLEETKSLIGSGGGGDDSAVTEAVFNQLMIDNFMSKLDFRVNEPAVIACAGDSIADSAKEWFELGLAKLFAQYFPDRPLGGFRINPTTIQYGSRIMVQAGVGDSEVGVPGNYVVFDDQFNRGGNLSGIEAVGDKPDLSNGNWQGPTGKWQVYNNSVLQVVPNATLSLSDTLYALVQAHDTDAISVNGQALHRLGSNTSATVTTQTALLGGAGKTGIYHEVVASTAGVTASLVIKTSTTERKIAFPTGGMPAATVDNYPIFTLTVAGADVSAIFGIQGQNKSLTATLTSAEITALKSWDRVWTSTTDPKFRIDNMTTSARTTPTSGASDLAPVTFYNAAIAGTTIDTHIANMNVMYPVKPDVICIGHSMNNTTDTAAVFLAKVQDFVDKMNAKFGGDPIPVFFMGQNPRYIIPGSGTPGTRPDDHRKRVRAARNYAKRKGWLYIPGFELFAGKADGGKSLLESADGMHPTLTTGGGAEQMADLFARKVAALSERQK